MVYDPAKAHDYYERTKQLMGREAARHVPPPLKVQSSHAVKSSPKKVPHKEIVEAKDRVVRLAHKLTKLQKALKETNDLLYKKRHEAQKSRATAKKTEAKNSDGKTTAKEKAASKNYRDAHKGKTAAKASAKSASSGSSSPKGPSHTAVKDMSVDDLVDRMGKIRDAMSMAKSQLKKANAEVHTLKHSMMDSDNSDELQHNSIEEGDSHNGTYRNSN